MKIEKSALFCNKRWVMSDGSIPLSMAALHKVGLNENNVDIYIDFKKFNSKSNKAIFSKHKIPIWLPHYFSSVLEFKFIFLKVNPLNYLNWIGDGFNKNFLIKYIKYINHFIFMIFFGSFLKKNISKYKKIFVICGYDRLNSSIIYLANTLGIETYEIQHGIIHKRNESVYLKRDIVGNLVSKNYILWSEEYSRFIGSREKVNLFFTNFEHLKLNKFSLENISDTKKYDLKLLVAFDDVNPIPQNIQSLISKEINTNFYLRPHPKSSNKRIFFIKSLSNKFSNATFVDSSKNISSYLKLCDLVLVDISSVCIEMASFKKPAYYYNKSTMLSGIHKNKQFIYYIEIEKLDQLVCIYNQEILKKIEKINL